MHISRLLLLFFLVDILNYFSSLLGILEMFVVLYLYIVGFLGICSHTFCVLDTYIVFCSKCHWSILAIYLSIYHVVFN